ncbi:hypothetical protein [Nocardia wallacei]|uniref:hypothetical protein n=1 Tax=Nocardia wallacei TaxID=480035 RepID=UPI0024566656|nr:hypothetical protein [Nocardia wallacei]
MTNKHPARRTTRRKGPAPGAIPSTLWAAGPEPIRPDDSWPPRILARALLEYSRPGDRVLLIPHQLAADVLVGELDRAPVPATDEPQVADSDLIIATTLAGHAEDIRPWMPAEVASSRLRPGGLLVVFTRCRHDSNGELHDLSGDVVTEAQHNDLLYLQHLIAAPVHDGAIVATPTDPGDSDSPGEPADIVHTDVLVFLQPHDFTTAA